MIAEASVFSKVLAGVVTAGVIGFGAMVFHQNDKIAKVETAMAVHSEQYRNIERQLTRIELSQKEMEREIKELSRWSNGGDPRIDELQRDVTKIYKHLTPKRREN